MSSLESLCQLKEAPEVTYQADVSDPVLVAPGDSVEIPVVPVAYGPDASTQRSDADAFEVRSPPDGVWTCLRGVVHAPGTPAASEGVRLCITNPGVIDEWVEAGDEVAVGFPAREETLRALEVEDPVSPPCDRGTGKARLGKATETEGIPGDKLLGILTGLYT